MDILDDLKNRHGFEPGAGFVETALAGVRFFWSTEPVARAPLIYNAGLVLVLQGNKKSIWGTVFFITTPIIILCCRFHCLLSARPMPQLTNLCWADLLISHALI